MRDFYKYAAHLANPLLEQKNLSNAFFSQEEEKPAFSQLLEPTFQEIYLTYDRPLEQQSPIESANPISWLKSESSAAKTFHGGLKKLATSRSAIALKFDDGQGEKEALLTRFVIFYAYRLRKKSWQVKGELDRSIRYFHLQGQLSGNQDFDLLYWVKGEDSDPVAGEFLTLCAPYYSINPLNLGEVKTKMAKESQ